MKMTKLATTSIIALAAMSPAIAQESTTEPSETQAGASDPVTVLAGWSYADLYTSAWSVDDLIYDGAVYGPEGEEIGSVENVIFSDDGQALSLIAEVGGFWDIGDTHISVPWDEVTISAKGLKAEVPVTEETVDDYGLYSENLGWFAEDTFYSAEADRITEVGDDLDAGPAVFKATDLIGDYAYLEGAEPYGYVNDVLVTEGSIQAVVIDGGTYYDAPGYYAYPYVAAPAWDPYAPGYGLPYTVADVGSMESFDYDQMELDE